MLAISLRRVLCAYFARAREIMIVRFVRNQTKVDYFEIKFFAANELFDCAFITARC